MNLIFEKEGLLAFMNNLSRLDNHEYCKKHILAKTGAFA